MNKEFDIWNGKKKIIHNEKLRRFFHEREIWFCHMGENVGFEQDGKGENFGRPVIIFKKFNKEVFWAIPLTTRDKGGKFYLGVDLKDGIHRMAILSQLRLMDAKRLYQKIGMIDYNTYQILQERIISLCQLTIP